MDRETKIRLATIIDCEGSISLYWAKDGDQYYNKPMVTVTSKDKDFAEQFQKEFGFGYMGKCGPNMAYHHWVACNIQAYIVCSCLHDFFRLKTKNADVILDYYKEKSKSKTYHLALKTAKYKYYEIESMKDGEKK